jgi:hypothetical protein
VVAAIHGVTLVLVVFAVIVVVGFVGESLLKDVLNQRRKRRERLRRR